MAFIFFCSLFRPFICPGRPSSHRSFGAGITARLLVEWNITISDKGFFTMSRMGEPLQSFRYRPSVHGDFFIFICIFFYRYFSFLLCFIAHAMLFRIINLIVIYFDTIFESFVNTICALTSELTTVCSLLHLRTCAMRLTKWCRLNCITKLPG